ncbi:MAG: Asp-tRNA(Asn)/Glu-tRNA(Gln) amidotransferase subunit GatC [Burkholderiaceae bacterium]
MPLTEQDIDRLAHLARLELQADERQQLLVSMNGFFDIVQQMRSVDTEGIEPLSHPVEVALVQTLRLRADVVSEANEREVNQKNAPHIERGLFLVPRVIE